MLNQILSQTDTLVAIMTRGSAAKSLPDQHAQPDTGVAVDIMTRGSAAKSQPDSQGAQPDSLAAAGYTAGSTQLP